MNTTEQALKAAKGLQHSVNTLMQAMAFKSLHQEKMDEIDSYLLKDWALMDDKGQEIKEIGLLYLSQEKEKVKALYEQRDDAIAAGNFPIVEKRGQCPSLMAGILVTQAERALILVAEPHFPGCTVDKLLASKNGLEAYSKYIDLLIKLVVNAPNYQKPQVLGGAA